MDSFLLMTFLLSYGLFLQRVRETFKILAILYSWIWN